MKQFFVYALIASVVMISCKEQPCEPASMRIAFVSYTDTEIDTVIVRKFAKAANFASPIDTFLLSRMNSSYYRTTDTVEVGNSYGQDNGLLSKYDYQIFLPRLNKLITLSDITEEIHHLSARLSWEKVACINPITYYKLNGKLKSGTNFYDIFYLGR